MRRIVFLLGLLLSPSAAAEAPATIAALAHREAERHGLDPGLVLAVIRAESSYNPRAVSPQGAKGLMQLMPGTARRFGVRDVFDPAQNVRGGCAYLAWLLRRYDGDVRLALAAYNAGEGAVDRYDGVPPYRETRAYVAKITGRAGLRTHGRATAAGGREIAWREREGRAGTDRPERPADLATD